MQGTVQNVVEVTPEERNLQVGQGVGLPSAMMAWEF